MSAIARRLAALEMGAATVTRPLLFIGRADLNDEADAIGFRYCPLVRADGEAWAVFKSRFTAWAYSQPEPFVIGHIQYREADR